VQNAIAFSNNDLITIAWSYGQRPDGCMGFAIHRIDDKGKETPLPSHAVFPGYAIHSRQTTDEFPIQKFYWKDPYARLVAEDTGNRTFSYKIIPLKGAPGKLTPMTNLPTIITNQVEITSEFGPGTRAIFNRGLISTQRISRAFHGHPGKASLLKRVADPKDRLRESLSGDMVEALTGFVDRAKTSGTIYAALYELQDAELLAKLEGLGKRLRIVLSNAVVTDDATKEKTDGNQPARDALAGTAKTKWDRLMPDNHIGHNKFLVYVDGTGKPRAVLLGSTNWTPTGLCTQTNNTLVIDDPKLARRYLDYWEQLAADTKAAGADPKSLQGTALRTWDGTGKSLKLGGKVGLQSWFSPNTPAARKKVAGEQRPVDMSAVVERMDGAKQAILFLAFYPGSPCVANWAAAAQRKNKDLFVRGCVTNVSAAEGFYYELRGITPPAKVKGERAPPKQDPRVFAAEAFDGAVIPEGWQKEILNAGFAIIHDKVVVIDPFSDQCVVVTGSHNLGHKASFDNDENLVIVEGNRSLAVAYATHVLDVYDHFSWRWNVKRDGKKAADQKLKTKPDYWLDRYFDADGNVKVAQLRFWMSAAL
jgi:phosphatidylserine/phosphatidylglycerophosphate/cardiolipin synthase-like enzyme